MRTEDIIRHSENPDFKNRIQTVLSGQHFMHFIGFEIKGIEPGLVWGELNIRQEHRQQNDFLHGGVTATLQDIASGLAALTLVKPDVKVVTAELSVSYLFPVMQSHVYARGWVYKKGKHLNYCESELFVEEEKLIKVLSRSRSIMANIFPLG